MSSHRSQKPQRKLESFDELKAAFLVEVAAAIKRADTTYPESPKRLRPSIAVAEHLKETLATHINTREVDSNYQLEVPDLQNTAYFVADPSFLYMFFRAWLRKKGINPSNFD